jgi:hypothetical protein
MPRPLLASALAAAIAALLALAVPAGAAPKPFGHACTAKLGVRVCQAANPDDAAATLDRRIPSFDGSPIDADVTLPARGNGPFPTIALLHGYGGSKLSVEADDRSTGVDDIGLARRGYAVVSVSARGFGLSCGAPVSRTPDCEGRGWIHLDDQRFEVRDVQHLLGRLVDEGVADPERLGATGGSYGGGLSLQLAYLKDRVRLPDGGFARWRSPKGRALTLAAAYPIVPWSDLVSALVPNGRSDDFLSPVGVPIQSYITGLYFAGAAAGWVAPAGVDPTADLAGMKAMLDAGEPYGADVVAAMEQVSRFKGVWELGGRPAPLLLASGWTDDLFPPVQTVRVYQRLRGRSAKAPVWLQLGDFGHARGGDHARDRKLMERQALAFFGRFLRGRRGGLPKPGSVLAFGQTCPKDAPRGLGPFRARSLGALTKDAVTVSAVSAQTVTSDGGDPALATDLEPTLGKGGDACSTYPAAIAPGTAVTSVRSRGFTYLGFGRVTATIDSDGPYGQLNARLWDVSGPTQRLVDRAVYRLTPDQQGRIAFDLHGNGYRFARGHTVRLELVGADAPTHRASNAPFTVAVSRLKVRLPVR